MASAAEQLTSSLSFSSFSKAKDLKKRIFFALAALVIYRLGTYVPLPGINPEVMGDLMQKNAGGILGMLDMFSGGAIGRMTIMSLNLMPYISASILVQLMTVIVPRFEALKKEGDTGRKKINQYTRYATVLLAAFQGYGVAIGLENMGEGSYKGAVLDPGLLFQMSTIVTLVGSTLFLMWLGEQITARGIGNGSSMIIYTGIAANLPQQAIQALELSRTGGLPFFWLFTGVCLIACVVAFIVFMECAHRKVLVQYPKRQMGRRIVAGDTTHLPIKLNSTGVIPPIFASTLLLLPATLGGFVSSRPDGGVGWNILYFLSKHLSHGSPVFIALYASLIMFFAFIYTSIVFDPKETAENIRKNSGFIPGYRPGKMTADYLDFLITRLTVLGGSYLAFICILPEILMSQITLSFYFGGTSLMILVGVTMDTVSQIHSHLISHQYDGLMRKHKKGGRR